MDDERKYRIVTYMRIDTDSDELLTFEEAIEERRQLKRMQPENKYEIEEV